MDTCSNPLYVFDWMYFNTPAGRQFLHYSDVVHKFSEGVIVQRREELLKVDDLFVLLHVHNVITSQLNKPFP